MVRGPSRAAPRLMVGVLDDLFSAFDELAEDAASRRSRRSAMPTWWRRVPVGGRTTWSRGRDGDRDAPVTWRRSGPRVRGSTCAHRHRHRPGRGRGHREPFHLRRRGGTVNTASRMEHHRVPEPDPSAISRRACPAGLPRVRATRPDRGEGEGADGGLAAGRVAGPGNARAPRHRLGMAAGPEKVRERGGTRRSRHSMRLSGRVPPCRTVRRRASSRSPTRRRSPR
ncbi:MAG: hypothetical protein K0R20_2161 [Actinomycetia bacterium]|nr:hypothetical protein [Actinomycetes bacterium]